MFKRACKEDGVRAAQSAMYYLLAATSVLVCLTPSLSAPTDYDIIDFSLRGDILAKLRFDNVTISFWFVAFGDNFSVQAWRQDAISVSPRLSLAIHADNNTKILREFPEMSFIRGHLLDRQGRSDIWGHITGDLVFTGSIHTETVLYNIHPAKRYLPNTKSKAIIFKNNNLQTRRFSDNSISFLDVTSFSINDSFYRIYKREGSEELKNKKCGVQLVSSHRFYKANGENIGDVLAAMVGPLMVANLIFSKIDFTDDGEPDNLGFMLESFIIHTDNKSDAIFGEGNNVHVNSTEALEKCGRILQKYCMQVCFLHTYFEDRVLGVAYIAKVNTTRNDYLVPGGMCFPPIWYKGGHFSSNVAVLTSKFNDQEAWHLMMGLTMAHEMGHAFGSEHDPPQGQCFPGGVQGNYIMAPDSQMGKKVNNRKFSPCSLETMRAVVAHRGSCLKAQPSWICGNGIVEADEECDCGNEASCSSVDWCCIPEGKHGECTVRRELGFVCSPKKYTCCNDNCQVRPATPPTSCHSGDPYCTIPSVCDGQKYKCPDRGFVPDGKACQNFTKTCLSGQCTSNVCHDNKMRECICSTLAEQCHVCCLVNETLCVSAEKLGFRDLQIFVKTNEPCPLSSGQCLNGVCVQEDFFSFILESLFDSKDTLVFFIFFTLLIMILMSTAKIVNTKFRRTPDSSNRIFFFAL